MQNYSLDWKPTMRWIMRSLSKRSINLRRRLECTRFPGFCKMRLSVSKCSTSEETTACHLTPAKRYASCQSHKFPTVVAQILFAKRPQLLASFLHTFHRCRGSGYNLIPCRILWPPDQHHHNPIARIGKEPSVAG